MTDLRYLSPDVIPLGVGAFLPTFPTKLKFYEISIYLHKVIELCINK